MNNTALLTPAIKSRIMDRAMTLSKAHPGQCYDFRIMRSPLRKSTLLLRWTMINIDDPDRPVQEFRFECFHMDGTPRHCSVNYADLKQANAFFHSLETLHAQDFACDHKVDTHV